jgi:hypothetical protein
MARRISSRRILESRVKRTWRPQNGEDYYEALKMSREGSACFSCILEDKLLLILLTAEAVDGDKFPGEPLDIPTTTIRTYRSNRDDRR